MRCRLPHSSLSVLLIQLGLGALLGGCAPLPEALDGDGKDGTAGSEDAGGELETATEDTHPPDSAMDTGEASELSSDELLLTSAECASLCAERAEHARENAHCDFEWRSGDCPTVCEEYGVFEWSTQDAMASCVLEDALCYEDVHTCVARRVYPGPSEAVLRLTATGFESVAGKSVVIGIDTASGSPTFTRGVTESGGFELTVTESVYAGSTQHAIFYVDVNENGRCDRTVDVRGGVFFERSADIDHLSFSGSTELPRGDHEYVCDFL